jgi:hypothetical protein
MAARGLPSSARCLTLRRLTEVRAVSVPDATAARTTQTMRTISSAQLWAFKCYTPIRRVPKRSGSRGLG